MRRLFVCGLLSLCATVDGSGRESTATPVALVYGLSGGGATAITSGVPAPLTLFAWLYEGTRIVAPADGHVLVCLHDGQRFEIRALGSATVSSATLTKRMGEVRALPRVPALPRLAPIVREGARPAAVRIREGGLGPLSPDAPHAVLADDVSLSWPSVPGVTQYRISVEDEAGLVVLQTETPAPPLKVSGTLLRPGASFFWTVSAIPPSGFAARGDAVFTVLPESVATARKALERALLTDDGPDGRDARALLAEVDRSLGLVR